VTDVDWLHRLAGDGHLADLALADIVIGPPMNRSSRSRTPDRGAATMFCRNFPSFVLMVTGRAEHP